MKPPRWPLHVVVWVLLPAAIAGTGALSATATLLLAEHHQVPVEVRPFLVAMVEVVSLSGTLLAIFAVTRRLRARAMVAVVGASLVALVAGWQAYGWVGALASLFLVYLVHLASEAWLELREHATSPAANVDQPVTSGNTPDPVILKGPVVDPDGPPTTPVDGPVHGPLTLVDTARGLDPELSERSAAAELGITRHRLRTLRIEMESGLAEVSA